MPSKFGKERVGGSLEHPLQQAAPSQNAGAGIPEARREFHIRLRPSHDISKIDGIGWLGQPDAAIATSGGFNVSRLPEFHYHRVQMQTRNAIG